MHSTIHLIDLLMYVLLHIYINYKNTRCLYESLLLGAALCISHHFHCFFFLLSLINVQEIEGAFGWKVVLYYLYIFIIVPLAHGMEEVKGTDKRMTREKFLDDSF